MTKQQVWRYMYVCTHVYVCMYMYVQYMNVCMLVHHYSCFHDRQITSNR